MNDYPYPLTPNDQAAIEQGCYFDVESAYEPVDWIESFCRLSDGARAGQRVKLLEWQKEALMKMFGWKQANGLRRYRRVYITIGKKNAKSTFCSALAAYLLEMDGEDGAYIYLTAVDSDQTSQVFHPCSEMIKRSPDLAKRYQVLPSRNLIKFGTNAWIKAISSDSGGSEGLNAHALIIDELHAWDNNDFYDSLKFASIARAQPLEITITTRGDDPDSICGIHEEHFLKVAKGEIINIHLLPIFYCAEPEDDLEDIATWKKANPALGVITSVDEFRIEWEAAKQGSPRERANFLRRRFNLWQRGFFPFFDVNKWNALAKDVDDDELLRCPCYAALDLSSKDDFTSVALCFLLDSDDYYIKTFHFIPQEKINETILKGQSLYSQWAKAGYLTACKGHVIRRSNIIEQLENLSEKYQFKKCPLAIDAWAAQQIVEDLEDRDYEVFAFRQGFKSMSPPTKEMDEAIKAGRLYHDSNPVMSWMIQNAVVVEDAHENIKIIKRSGTKLKEKRFKVDAVVSTVMAIDGAMRHRGLRFSDSNRPIVSI